jgi:glycosyltransferase involved in cell wall biosynthesis
MKIAIIAPSPVPYTIGGAEKLWWGMLHSINQQTHHQAELIKIPSPERNFPELIASYKAFSQLDLSHFDRVISTKYPAWMVDHPEHYCYLQHKLRGLYDTYHFTNKPTECSEKDYPTDFSTLFNILEQQPSRECLESLFGVIESLLSQYENYFDFPGPLTRKIVHFLDSVAQRPGAIVEYSAISETVAARKDYFPVDQRVRVTHHPSDLIGIKQGEYDYIFTVSRLDSAKRLDLLITAFKEIETDIKLKIAGVGPDEVKLKSLANGDERIEFLGRVTDTELIELYSNALFVPFMPYDEDFGLITIEAMTAHKAVLTTTDSGGVTEFVKTGETGFVCQPTVDSIREGLNALLASKGATIDMGHNGAKKVAAITWSSTMKPLLEDHNSETFATEVIKPKKIVVTSTFPVWPPQGGGQARIFNLYREVARYHDVTIVSLSDKESDMLLAPNYRQITVKPSDAQLEHTVCIRSEAKGADVDDIAAIDGVLLNPQFLFTLKEQSAEADIVVASHPYLYKAIRKVWRGPIGYDSHNVELDMKRAILPDDSTESKSLISSVEAVEKECVNDSQWVMACSQDDLDRYSELYNMPLEKTGVVNNGYDLASAVTMDASQRTLLKKRLGVQDGTLPILFTGSWHGPNIEAAKVILEIAVQLPDEIFWIMGSVCQHPVLASVPDNVRLLGVVTEAEKQVVMAAASIALNPMISGSGTNLKMLDYAANQLNIISTFFGNRGLGFQNGSEVTLCELENFTVELLALLKKDSSYRSKQAQRAKKRVEKFFGWDACALNLLKALNH